MNSSVKLILVPVFAGILMVTGITAALAQSEVGGNLDSGTTTPSYADGALVASISDPQSTTTVAAASEPVQPERTGGRSSTRKAPYGGAQPSQAYDPLIIIDGGSLAAEGELTGTGGGFDPETEAVIAQVGSDGGSGDNGLSPSDAVAFNNSQNPFLTNTDIAATGDTDLGSTKVWTAVVLGLALLGLAGYAVNALISYRRENDL